MTTKTKVRPKTKTETKKKYKFIYADIETIKPSTTPMFWYGGYKESGGEFHWHSNFKDYWENLIELEKGLTKIIVFHNSMYDISILQWHACQELGYTFNPKGNGQSKAIYTANASEIYQDDNTSVTFVLDSTDLMPGTLASWGEKLGKPKLDFDYDNQEWREPTKTDIEYLQRDIEILEEAYRDLVNGEEYAVQGLLTQSSATQAELKQTWAEVGGKPYKRNGLKRQFSGNVSSSEPLPLPSAVKTAIEADLRAFKEKQDKESTTNGKRLYGLNNGVYEQAESKLRAYYSKLYVYEYGKEFRQMQKQAKEELDEKQYPKDFMELEIPYTDEINEPKLEAYADDFNHKAILSSMNDQVRGAMKGGISAPNPEIVGIKTGAGGTLDINSMYPSILMTYELPYHYVGSTDGLKANKSKYFIAEIVELEASVKKEKHPFLKGATKFTSDEGYYPYIHWKTDRKNNTYRRALTSIELIHLQEVYDVEKLELGRIFYYKPDDSFTLAIRKHIEKWAKIKENTPKSDPLYMRAKMMLNTLWGRWSMYEKSVDSGGVKIDVGDKDTNMISGVFTTAYARIHLNKAMNHFGKDFLYCDTDSIHFKFSDDLYPNAEALKKGLGKVLDPNKFGMWDLEEVFDNAKYLKSKTYAHEIDGEIYTTTSGITLPKGTFETLDEFYSGRVFPNTKSKTLPDGRQVILKSPFTL